MRKLYDFLIGRSIRLRLTVIYSIGVGLALVVLSLTVYRSINNNLNREVDRDLRQRNEEVSRFFMTVGTGGFSEADLDDFARVFGGEPESTATPLPVVGNQSSTNFELTKNTLAASLVYLQVLDKQGNLLQAVPENKLMQKPKNQDMLADLRLGASHYDTVKLPTNNEKVRVHTQPLYIRGQQVGYIQSIRSMQEIDTIVDSLALPFIIGTVLTTLFLAALGWWVTRRTFAPVERITDAAYRIGVNNNMGERIAVDARFNDEVTRMGRAFNAMLERLDKSFEAQKQFVADSSHELRTPLTVIKGNLDLLKRNPDPQNQAECLQAIGRETVRMQRLVQDLLLLAQGDNIQKAIDPNPVQLDSLLFDIYKDARILADAKGHTLKLSHFEPVLVEGDAEQLKRAIINLVENAIKYTPDGGEISLALYSGNKWARVVISDNGLGIASEDQPRIFDRFFRVDKARSRAGGGSGLGLAIVKFIVEAHGGRIQLESESGKGSTFTIWLRLNPQEFDEDLEAVGDETEPIQNPSAV